MDFLGWLMGFLQYGNFNALRSVVVVVVVCSSRIFCLGVVSFAGPGKRAGTGLVVGGLTEIAEQLFRTFGS